MNGVIETSTGRLLRYGGCDFENESEFDSGTETYRTDVPEAAKSMTDLNINGYNVSKWNGSSWEEEFILSEYKKIFCDAINKKTDELVEVGFTYDSETFSLSKHAQTVWNTLHDNTMDFSDPIDISTTDYKTYSLARNEVDTFWEAGRSAVASNVDSGLTLLNSIYTAIDKAAVDAVVDAR